VGIYRLTSGRHRRFEDGQLSEYVAGDLVDLDEKESRRLAHRIKPVGSTKAKAKATASKPASVFTPRDTSELTVPMLTAVVTNAKEPAQLDDIEEQERKGKKRVTVFRAIERRRKHLSGDKPD